MDGYDERKTVFEEITLGEPPPLRIEHASVAVDKIDFDPDNPRLRYQRAMFPEKSIEDLLFKNTDTSWLKKDIKNNGLLDSIYVMRTELGRYLVIEGNRRTGCVKELHKELPDDPRFAWIPARILPQNTTKNQAAMLMASYHIAGKIKWEAHEKAGHIYHMLNNLRIPEAELSAILHMGVPAIKRIALSYEILDKVYKTIDGGAYADKAEGKWSFFEQMLMVKHLRDFNAKDPSFAETFSRWVGEGRIPRAEDVKKLPDILKRAKARRLFEMEPIEQAWTLAIRESNYANPASTSKFFEKLEKMTEACRHAPFEDIQTAQENEQAKSNLSEAYRVLTGFMEQAKVRLPIR